MKLIVLMNDAGRRYSHASKIVRYIRFLHLLHEAQALKVDL